MLREQCPPYHKFFLRNQTIIMKHLITFAFLLFFLKANAQLDKGYWLVGGTGSFYSYNENYSTLNLIQKGKWTDISIAPSIGYFIVDKFSGGVRALFSSSKGTNKSTNGTITKSNQYYITAGPFVRYYFLEKDKPFNLLTDVGYQFGINQYLGALHQRGKYNIFSTMGGIEAFFNSSASIEILLGYYQKKVSIDDNTIAAFNDTKSGFQVSIGFQLHLIKE